MRKWNDRLCLAGIFGFIALLCWNHDWMNHLPRPVSADYLSVRGSQPIDPAGKLYPEKNTAIFLHFFSPACPCLPAGITYFKLPQQEDGNPNRGAVIIITKGKNYDAGYAAGIVRLRIPVIFQQLIFDQYTLQDALADCRTVNHKSFINQPQAI